MKDYIKNKLAENKMFFLFGKIPVNVIGTIHANIILRDLIYNIERIFNTKKYFKNIDQIYFGNFNFLNNRKIQSMYSDNCIYVSDFNNKENVTEYMVLRDIIHEIGHSLENDYGIDLYGDGELELEYYGKKKKVLQILKDIGYNFSEKEFLSSSEYSEKLDKFLYSDVGYDNLSPLIVGLFISPYSATSLSEYYSNGFEQYHTGDKNYLQKICPVLYNKIKELDQLIKRG